MDSYFYRREYITQNLLTMNLFYDQTPSVCIIYICRLIKTSLCTWWLQYRKLQVMFKVSPASHQIFIDPLAERQDQEDTGLTLTPSVIPNSNYVIMVSDWNCLKYFCMFLYCNHMVHRDFLITLYRTHTCTHTHTHILICVWVHVCVKVRRRYLCFISHDTIKAYEEAEVHLRPLLIYALGVERLVSFKSRSLCLIIHLENPLNGRLGLISDTEATVEWITCGHIGTSA
jgi:hypothetical protein